jgi:tight adherence protein C
MGMLSSAVAPLSALTILAVLAVFASACAVYLIVSEWLRAREKSRNLREAKKRLGVDGATKREGDKAGGMAALIARIPLRLSRQRREAQLLKASYERDLPALLEVIALGMQAGMGFDQSFALYTERFDTPLARCCQERLAVWTRGLISRDAGMRELADCVATPSFRHFTSSALRALRFGAPMTQLLLDLAQEARGEYRAERQEIVAKAPVKMLLPTGALILPAMLLLVMGPILLDLIGRM